MIVNKINWSVSFIYCWSISFSINAVIEILILVFSCEKNYTFNYPSFSKYVTEKNKKWVYIKYTVSLVISNRLQ